VGHRLGLATRTQISVCKSPFPSAGTALSLSMRKRFSRDHTNGRTYKRTAPSRKAALAIASGGLINVLLAQISSLNVSNKRINI